MSELETLPEGWVKMELDNVCEVIRGVTFPSSVKSDSLKHGHIACLRTTNVQESVEWENLWFIPESIVKREEQLIREEDILISNANSFELVGKVARVNSVPQRATLGAFISLIRPSQFVGKGYLYWILKSSGIQDTIKSMASTTTNISNVSVGKLKLLKLNIAPEKEQIRIVEKLEELLSDLDNGVAELKAAQIKLTQYRQSLLKSAVEGSLTAEWRLKNQPSETGLQLLQRILIERRQRWEQQKRDEFKQKNQKPPKDWQLNYPEPVKPDTSELPDLPEGWVWASLDMLGYIASGVTKGTKRKMPVEVFETPYLRVANVQRGYLDLSEIKTIPATQSEIENYTLKKGDILFNEGGDRDKLGRGWVWYGECSGQLFPDSLTG